MGIAEAEAITPIGNMRRSGGVKDYRGVILSITVHCFDDPGVGNATSLLLALDLGHPPLLGSTWIPGDGAEKDT